MRCLLGLIIIMVSCGSKQTVVPHVSDQLTEKLLLSPAVKYPSVDYDEVAFYRVNSKHFKDENLVSINRKQNSEETIGFAILDSVGNPAYQNIECKFLLPVEINELQSIFHLPENNGEITKNNCIAYFRDAFVFYKDKRQVAQAQICFDCNQIYFSLDTSHLAERFSTDGDWDRLEKFISTIKFH